MMRLKVNGHSLLGFCGPANVLYVPVLMTLNRMKSKRKACLVVEKVMFYLRYFGENVIKNKFTI